MLPFSPVPQARRTSWLSRRRSQLLGAILIAALLPLLFRLVLTPESLWVSSFNAFWANIVAVVLALWLRLSVEPYPGIRSSLVILPTCLAAHGAVLAFFFFTRLPYDRTAFVAGFLLHVAWFYFVYFAVQRRNILQIGVVPIGEWEKLIALSGVSWIRLEQPQIDLAARCDAIVADFSADLSPKWEAFLADAALAGLIVYQVKPLMESLTGRSRSTTCRKTASDRWSRRVAISISRP
jgi:hypothetical protein